jgi:hypothetical protein
MASKDGAISPERDAELTAIAKEFLRDFYNATPKPKAVVVKDQVVRDANVEVSKADRNYPTSDEGVVRVRRPDYVTINFAEYERQQAEKAAYKRYLKDLDPCRLGLYGPLDDDED